MRLLLELWPWQLFVSLVSATGGTWVFPEKYDRLCNPTDPPGLAGAGFSGFRIYRRVSYGLPFLHHWQVAYCRGGVVDISQFFVTVRDSNFMWNEPFCLSEGMCFEAARRKRYAQRNMAIYSPEAEVGGLFHCENASNCSDPVPVLPLIASNQAKSFGAMEGLRYVKNIPIFHTPDAMLQSLNLKHFLLRGGVSLDTHAWARDVDPDENYEYTDSDLFTPWHAANVIVNALAHVRIDENYLPWEFDALSRALALPEPTSSSSPSVPKNVAMSLNSTPANPV